MRALTRQQFWVLLTLAERPQQAAGIRSKIRIISNYQIWLHRNSVRRALQGLVAAELIEPCHDLRYQGENWRPDETWQLTVKGRHQLHQEALLQHWVLKWARRQLDEP